MFVFGVVFAVGVVVAVVFAVGAVVLFVFAVRVGQAGAVDQADEVAVGVADGVYAINRRQSPSRAARWTPYRKRNPANKTK